MLIQRKTLLWIFVFLLIFSIYSDGFAQSGQNSNTELSESQYIKIIEEIRKLETKMTDRISQLETKMTDRISQLDKDMRAHVDVKVSELSKDINELRSDVSYLNGQLSIIKWVMTIIGAPILVGLIIIYFQNRKNKTMVDTENQITENKMGNPQNEIVDPIDFLSRETTDSHDNI